MKPELNKIFLPLALGLLAAALSSCSLVGKRHLASQWEIESDVPASLSSGRAATPAASAGTQVKSNLDGLAQTGAEALDLPGSENGVLSDIPKPDSTAGGWAAQSPPEMLNIPSASSSDAGDLPYTTGTPSGIETLLPAPPPMVTEEELNMVPTAVASTDPLTPAPAPAPPDLHPAGTATAPSIPLLYGKLDLAPFLNPPTPLAVNTPAPLEIQ